MRIASSVRHGIILAIATTAAPLQVFGQPQVIPEIVRYELAANQDTPELCFVLNQTLPRQPPTAYESFVGAEPAAQLAAAARGDRLCLDGFAFGVTYTITLKAGLPGLSGALAKDVQYRIQIPDRPPELAFPLGGDGVLPRLGDGLPIRSVNVPRIEAEIFHVSDRDLLSQPLPAKPLTAAAATQFAPARGERAWHGVVETKGEPNRDTVTNLALDKTIGALKPGLYVAVAWPSGTPVMADKRPLASQYFTVSDLGLTAYRAQDGLAVAVRSLATAAAVPGVDIAVVARNNRELGHARTDDTGIARVDPAILRGAAGDAPASLYAYGAGGEFGMLSFDSMPVAKPATVRLLPDHPRYDAGDTVRLLALSRPAGGARTPLILAVHRPDGMVVQSLSLEDQGAGGYATSFTLPRSNAAGQWRIDALAGDDGRVLGSSAVTVVAPDTQQLAVGVGVEAALLDPEQLATVTVQTQFPNGQPAAGTPGDLRVQIAPAANPFPAFPGFAFGVVDETDPTSTLEPIHFTTDGGGKATVPVKLGPPPRATGPLEAAITARALDLDGRAVDRTITVPIATHPLLLGIKMPPDGMIPDGQPAHFEAIALSPDGERQEKAGVGWEIAREDFAPSWSWDGTKFAYRPAAKDTKVAGGTVDIPANASGMIDATLPAGRYRVAVFDPDGDAASSTRFVVGWAPPLAGRAPDTVALAPTKPTYTAGEGADIFIKPPFDADVVLGAGDHDIRGLVVQHVPAAGGTIHLDIPREASGGVRLVATALAPPGPVAPGLPRRAIGTGVLAADPAQRRLDVTLELPDKAQPNQTLSVPVTVGGMGEEPAFIAVTLEDAGEDGPMASSGEDTASSGETADGDPIRGLSVGDVYDRIITPSGVTDGSRAWLKTEPAPSTAAAEADPRANASWSSGVVALDKTGKATVPMQLPDFTGTLRVRVIAWSASRVGETEAALPVHNPLSVALRLPAFLAPEDRAELTLALDNSDGPRGEYHIALHAAGAVALQDESEIVINLAEHEQRSQSVTIVAHAPGTGAITIAVKGPNGLAFERRLTLLVQPTGTYAWRHATATVKPGATFTLDPALSAGLRPDSVGVSLTASAGGDFDLPGLARELIGAGYDSAERIVDQALPYLAPAALAQPPGLPSDEAAAGRLRRAVDRALEFQTTDGGFSLWQAAGASDPWLSAYVTEFLGRAKASGAAVPAVRFERALDYVALHQEPEVAQGAAETPPQSLEVAAYANKVLAGNGRLDIYQLRYFAERFAGQLRAPATLGLLASAFAALDDKAAAVSLFAQASSLPGTVTAPDEFASELRDQAMVAALMAESGAVAQPLVAAALAKAAATAAAHHEYSGDEAAWIFRAQSAAPAGTGVVALKVGDRSVQQTGAIALAVKSSDGPQSIRNSADTAVRLAITVSGIPSAAEASQPGFEIQRSVFDTTGKPVDPATVHQNDVLVVVLSGRFTGQGDARTVVIDPLPAGWTMIAPTLTEPAGRYPWLKDLTAATTTASMPDRYVAAPVLTGDRREFKLAYVVRASVRGQFAMPGTVIEDMAQPALSARLNGGRTKVDAPAL